MAWITLKSGKHINTDWFEKEEQIKKNKEQADKLNGTGKVHITNSGTGSSSKVPGKIKFGSAEEGLFKGMVKPGSTGNYNDYKGAKRTGTGGDEPKKTLHEQVLEHPLYQKLLDEGVNKSFADAIVEAILKNDEGSMSQLNYDFYNLTGRDFTNQMTKIKNILNKNGYEATIENADYTVAGSYRLKRGYGFQYHAKHTTKGKKINFKKLQNQTPVEAPKPVSEPNPKPVSDKKSPEAIAQRFANNLSKQGISNEWEIKAWLMSKSSGYRNSLAKDIGIPGKGDERVDALAHKLYVTGKGGQDTPKVETPKVEAPKQENPIKFEKWANGYMLVDGSKERFEEGWDSGINIAPVSRVSTTFSSGRGHSSTEYEVTYKGKPVSDNTFRTLEEAKQYAEQYRDNMKTEPPKPVEPEYERTPKMDWIEKRIEGKQKELEKAEKKMERIQKAKASDYKENNPYYYNDYDLRSTQKDIDNAKKTLEDYKKQMEQEIEKAKSRNVPVITDFLNDWEKRSIEYFKDQKERYAKAYEIHRAEQEEMRKQTRWDSPLSDEEKHKISKQAYEDNRMFKQVWHHVTQFNDGQGTWEENMKRAIAKEKVAKYDDIITRTNDLIGQITDAGALHIGKKGDLNGIIIGTKGKATVETIGAGGYNIQRYHFRTLINKLKEK